MMLLAAVSGRGALYPEAFSSGRPVGPIPDGNPAGVAFGGSVRDIPSGGTVSGVSISGGFTGDLYAYLLATNGTQVEPLNQPVASGAGGAITFNGSMTDGKGTLNFADLWTGGAVPAFPGLPVNQTEKVAGLTVAVTGFTSGVSSAFDVGKWAATVAATGGNKIYNGTTTAMVTLADHQVFGGAVADSYTRASFGWQNVGNGQPVSVSGNSISGPAAGNDNFQNLLHNRTASTSASLPALAVTWSGSRAYDRPTAAAANLTLGNNFNGVNLTLPGSVPLAVKNAGSPMISAVALAPGGSATANVQGTPYTKTFNTGSSVGTIPDGNPVGVTFVGTVSGTPSGGIVGGLTVGLNISGGYNGDLYAYLVAPNGTLVVLLNQPGVSGSNPFGASGAGMNNITLQDAATGQGSIQNVTSGSVLSGSYNAAGTLVSFNGSVADGTWTLFFADMSSGGGTSTLDSWSLNIEAVPEPVNVALGIFGMLLGGLALARHHATKRRSVLQPQA
jgi:subtilisin-like proprotein convertase family protein